MASRDREIHVLTSSLVTDDIVFPSWMAERIWQYRDSQAISAPTPPFVVLPAPSEAILIKKSRSETRRDPARQ